MPTTFLSAADLRELTGRARADAQIAALRRMGIAFWINAAGKPVVARNVLECGKPTANRTWEPRQYGTQA